MNTILFLCAKYVVLNCKKKWYGLNQIVRIGAGDPGKMRDSFGYLVGDIDIEKREVRIRKAKRWLGRSYKKVVQYIADDYVKNKLDHLVIERNNTGEMVIEEFRIQYRIPAIPVVTGRELKSQEKINDVKVMDKNEMVKYYGMLKKDFRVKFPNKFKTDEDRENFEELKRQIAIFAEHRTESGKSFAYYAPGEEHDDMVMALLLLLHLARYYLREKNKGFGVASRSYTGLRNNDEDLLGSGIPANATLKYRSVTNP